MTARSQFLGWSDLPSVHPMDSPMYMQTTRVYIWIGYVLTYTQVLTYIHTNLSKLIISYYKNKNRHRDLTNTPTWTCAHTLSTKSFHACWYASSALRSLCSLSAAISSARFLYKRRSLSMWALCSRTWASICGAPLRARDCVCVCVCVCIFTYVCVCMYLCMRVFMYTQTYMHAYKHAHRFSSCMHVTASRCERCARVCIRQYPVCIHVCECMCMYACILRIRGWACGCVSDKLTLWDHIHAPHMRIHV